MESSHNANLIEEAFEALKHQQLRLKIQRRRMVRWRNERKEELTTIRDEIQRLEGVLEKLLHTTQARLDELSPESTSAALYKVTIERAALQRENQQLHEEIRLQLDVENKLKRETDKFLSERQEESTVARTSMQLAQDIEGWWVEFPNGEPPFFFSPLSKEEYLGKLKQREIESAERHLYTTSIGNLLGWTVDYVPPFQLASGTTMAHARFSKQLRCSLTEAIDTLIKLYPSWWPMVISPRSWGREQRGDFYCRPLQSFAIDDLIDDHVVVCNIPGNVHLRYIAVVQNSLTKMPNGRLVARHCIMIVDTDANARIREAEGPQDDVQWVLEGGESCIFTEVGENTINVVYDQWAECLSEAHGRELYVDWIRFPIRLERFIEPARMLQG
ncbi:hypothetical protein PPTG_11394 [Phytophthora nicotianae INRA-310]|uniref:Uncharacterized protein n=1 Tax=Phytophthora nicotianae (strain INRA-310) TaxID=761204 RepID=W2QC34_PHYN3|nr:hypothetical protein PPTG_11394 [Phytophthora nicotianae INRA-310]ETN09805.1 hypothetical protein PPTG_11394 [Phytophthora nicotianae INRA-310]